MSVNKEISIEVEPDLSSDS